MVKTRGEIRDSIRRALRTPRRRARDAENARAYTVWRAERGLREALSTVPRPIDRGAFSGYTCPWCDAEPVGGWKWRSEPGTHFERLHLLLRCERRHQWAIDTDMG